MSAARTKRKGRAADREFLEALGRHMGYSVEEVATHEAVLLGLREEGLLTGPRHGWRFDPSRPLAEEEVAALAFAAYVAACLNEFGFEWEA